MRDPRVLDAVGRVWEGRPELSLPTLFAMLANRGVGWGATDEDLLRELAVMERERPARLSVVDASYLILAGDHRVTVDPWRVIVRRPGVTAQPGVWDYSSFRPVTVGGPLVLTSRDGIDHRLGEVTAIKLIDAAATESLDGLQRRDMEDRVYLLVLEDESTVLLSHGLQRFITGRRELAQEQVRWESLQACTPAEPLVVLPPGGGRPLEFAAVSAIYLVEA
ncbi:MAG: hypothetical protein Q4G50_13440 [Corynebacterium sp.]|uniref:hypothetical protein n=1 Tax=Corynebacterium sp. TaxID=1720 RepID=UPI0026E096BB|nr:hypothetical protein [Corynebacterium sp.]MDO5670988.1 hypothetical protein [Corynebacterium sp.]